MLSHRDHHFGFSDSYLAGAETVDVTTHLVFGHVDETEKKQ
jgi:hypothetical protein